LGKIGAVAAVGAMLTFDWLMPPVAPVLIKAL
jgi:hypothetical protein